MNFQDFNLTLPLLDFLVTNRQNILWGLAYAFNIHSLGYYLLSRQLQPCFYLVKSGGYQNFQLTPDVGVNTEDSQVTPREAHGAFAQLLEMFRLEDIEPLTHEVLKKHTTMTTW